MRTARIAAHIAASLVAGLGLALALLSLTGRLSRSPAVASSAQSPSELRPEAASPITRYVATTGSDVTTCTVPVSPCRTVQHAVDVAVEGDVIKIATGTYTGVHERSAPAWYCGPSTIGQVVIISKTVTIRGGYTTTNWAASYPATQPTTLDARGQGRVLFIVGDISPTVKGLRITGGDSAGLGGEPHWRCPGSDAGGGVYVASATVTLTGNWVVGNAGERGGGVYLWDSDATVGTSSLTSNTAHLGGGLYLRQGNATVDANVILGNTAADGDGGGGIYIWHGSATITNNIISSNTTSAHGGGVCVRSSSATIVSNTFRANTANGGGGVCVGDSTAALSGNTFTSNTAWTEGGGLLAWSSAGNVTLRGNRFTSNTAGAFGGGVCLYFGRGAVVDNTFAANSAQYGGGLCLFSCTATLGGNIVTYNTATLGGGLLLGDSSDGTLIGNVIISNAADEGGGLDLHGSDPILANNLIAHNRAGRGSGLNMRSSSPRLLHTTIARNRAGSAIQVYPGSSVVLTNTILVDNATGISVSAGSSATLEATLWGTDTWANETDWSGAGNITTGTVNVWGEPAFVNPAAADYHIGPGSAAIDRGADAGVTTDIDGGVRPRNAGYDLGADEYDGSCFARLNDGPIYPTVQAAVDASTQPTDVVKVAGTCAGVEARAGLTQTVYVSKTLTIQGGYTTTNWVTPHPLTLPTTLDARGQGRVFYITGDISPTIEGLRITGGNAFESHGEWHDAKGGGIYVGRARAVITGSQVFSNVAL